jgi:hypothetical protein
MLIIAETMRRLLSINPEALLEESMEALSRANKSEAVVLSVFVTITYMALGLH